MRYPLLILSIAAGALWGGIGLAEPHPNAAGQSLPTENIGTVCVNRSTALDDVGFREQRFEPFPGVGCIPGSISMVAYPIQFSLDKESAPKISAVTICCSLPKAAIGTLGLNRAPATKSEVGR